MSSEISCTSNLPIVSQTLAHFEFAPLATEPFWKLHRCPTCGFFPTSTLTFHQPGQLSAYSFRNSEVSNSVHHHLGKHVFVSKQNRLLPPHLYFGNKASNNFEEWLTSSVQNVFSACHRSGPEMMFLEDLTERKCWKENRVFPSHFHTCHTDSHGPQPNLSEHKRLHYDCGLRRRSRLHSESTWVNWQPTANSSATSNLNFQTTWICAFSWERLKRTEFLLVEVGEVHHKATDPEKKETSLRVHSAETWNFNEKNQSEPVRALRPFL